jgi:spermidine/putrescine-binding protein
MWNTRISRRDFLKLSAASGLAVAGASALAGCGGTESAQGAYNWMTWSDHYFAEQLQEAETKYGIKVTPTLFSDNSEAFLKTQQLGGEQLDMVSGDALWVKKYYDEGLIEAFDLDSLATAKYLHPVVKDFTWWQAGSKYLAFPFGWSPVPIAYNPKYVDPVPNSWEVLWDPKYKGKLAMELQPFDVMAMMGKSLGIQDAYNMTPDQIGQAKQQLIDLKPSLLKFVEQNTELVTLMADETIWFATVNLGMEDRVKQAGGPEVKTFIPKEGTVGWMDGEMLVKDGTNHDVAWNFLDKMETPEWLAKNFLQYGRPLLNQGALDILDQQGEGDRARRYYMDKPETLLSMTLKGPSTNMDAYIQAFNEALAS